MEQKFLTFISPYRKVALFIVFIIIQSLFTQAQPVIEWQKSLGGTASEDAYSVQQTADGGYIVAGQSYSTDGDVTGQHGGADLWITKLNSNGSLVWQKSMGGSGSEFTQSIQQTTDGGYIVAGGSNSTDGDVTGNHGGYDYWIVRLNSSGNIIWQKSYGGTSDESVRSIKQTNDGGFVVVGSTASSNGDVIGNHGVSDCWVLKLNSLGDIIWQNSLGGSSAERGNSVDQTSDGGYIIAGVTSSTNGDAMGNISPYNCWVIKLNNLGNLVWQKNYGGNGWDEFKSIMQTSDGGYIAAGFSTSTDGDVNNPSEDGDYWIVKLNATGTLVWRKSLGGTGYDEAKSIIETNSGDYIVAGYVEISDGDVTGGHGNGEGWIVKLDNSGTLVWQKALGGSLDDYAQSIYQNSDGSFVVAGGSNSTDGDISNNLGNSDFWIVKLKCPTYYADIDGDGYGNPSVSVQDCTQPTGYVLDNSDCNDNNPAVHQAPSKPSIWGAPPYVCLQGSIDWHSTYTGQNVWYFNGAVIAGQTTKDLTITQPGVYQVAANNGCLSPLSDARTVVQTSSAGNVVLTNTSESGYGLLGRCDENGWTYYSSPIDHGRYMFAIQWDPTNTGQNAAAKATASPAIYLMGSYSSATNTAGNPAKATFAMRRYWNVFNSAALTAPVNVRFFYTQAEVDEILAAASAFEAAHPGSIGTSAKWFKSVGENYWPANIVTANGLINSTILQNGNLSGNKINGVLYAELKNITSFSGGTLAITVGNATVLPIKLQNFAGLKVKENQNKLSWRVACTDERSNKLILERSSFNGGFAAIHNTATTPQNCDNEFVHFDNQPLKGNNYYRLKMVDADGKISYSNVVLLVNNPAGSISLSPNPTTTSTKVEVNATASGRATVSVVDAIGKTVVQQTATITQGQNTISLNVAHLAKGVYLVKVKLDDGSTTSLKLVKE